MLNKNPASFNPNVASFWSPNPNVFFVIGLASYINITPHIAKIIPNINKNFIVPHPLLLHLVFTIYCRGRCPYRPVITHFFGSMWASTPTLFFYMYVHKIASKPMFISILPDLYLLSNSISSPNIFLSSFVLK